MGEITEATITDLNNELNGYDNIKDFDLIINANKSRSQDELSKSLNRAYADLDQKNNIISGLQKEIEELQENITGLNQQIEAQNASNKNGIAFSALAKDAKIRFSDLEYFGYAKMLASKDFIKIDTLTVANIKWNSSINDSISRIKEAELQTWLKQELKTDKVIIKRN